MKLSLKTPSDFDFRSAVCSHGFFVLAPNRWDAARQTLNTIITLDDQTAATVEVTETAGGNISLRSADDLTPSQRSRIRSAVRRMLRLDEDLAPFHDFCRQSASHQQAANLHFGRLLRAASLFEDMVKVICTCNVTWRQTVTMIQNLVAHWGVPVGDTRPSSASGSHAASQQNRRGFPTPLLLARAATTALKQEARVGYRAAFIQRLARDVAENRLDLDAIEQFDGLGDELFKRLRRIYGIGDYAAAHLCMLLGRYDRLAVDSEMVRFLSEKHPRRKWTSAGMKTYYDPWNPFQFLAYWYELWSGYVAKHGQAHQWELEGVGRHITTRHKHPRPRR